MCSEISRISLSFHKFCGVHQGQVQAGGSSQQAGPVEGAPAHGRGGIGWALEPKLCYATGSSAVLIPAVGELTPWEAPGKAPEEQWECPGVCLIPPSLGILQLPHADPTSWISFFFFSWEVFHVEVSR